MVGQIHKCRSRCCRAAGPRTVLITNRLPPCRAVQMHEVQSGLNKTEFKVEGYTDVEEGSPHNLEEAWGMYAGEPWPATWC